MILRFNAETLGLIEKVSRKVRKRLMVDEVNLCVATGSNAASNGEKIEMSLCFETPEDDTFAVLDLKVDPEIDIKSLLHGFMNNPNVEWQKQGGHVEEPYIQLTLSEVAELDELLGSQVYRAHTGDTHKVVKKLHKFLEE